MKIAINFGDSDFAHTFKGVLNVLKENYKEMGVDLSLDKKKLAKIINEISFGIFLLNQGEECDEHSDEDFESIREWLKIEEDDLLTGSEVEARVKEGWDNGEVFILDMDLDFENNKCIFSL